MEGSVLTETAGDDFRNDEEIISTTTSAVEYYHQVHVNQYHYQYSSNYIDNSSGGSAGLSSTEIEEEVNPSDHELFEINNWNNNGREEGLGLASIKEEVDGSLFSFDIQNGEDNVYVAVGKSESSMDALAWTLKHVVNNRSTFVYLIHVFPELRYIPTPCTLRKSPPLSLSFYSLSLSLSGGSLSK